MGFELRRRPEDGRIQIKHKNNDKNIYFQERREIAAFDIVIRCLGFKYDDSIWHP